MSAPGIGGSDGVKPPEAPKKQSFLARMKSRLMSVFNKSAHKGTESVPPVDPKRVEDETGQSENHPVQKAVRGGELRERARIKQGMLRGGPQSIFVAVGDARNIRSQKSFRIHYPGQPGTSHSNIEEGLRIQVNQGLTLNGKRLEEAMTPEEFLVSEYAQELGSPLGGQGDLNVSVFLEIMQEWCAKFGGHSSGSDQEMKTRN